MPFFDNGYRWDRNPGAGDAENTLQTGPGGVDWLASQKYLPRQLRKAYKTYKKDPLGSTIGKAFMAEQAKQSELAKRAAYDPFLAQSNPNLARAREAVAVGDARTNMAPSLFSALANKENSYEQMMNGNYGMFAQLLSGKNDSLSGVQANAYKGSETSSGLSKVLAGLRLASTFFPAPG